MKPLRPLLLGAIVVAIVVLAVLGLALMPAVQTWAARKVVANQPDAKIDIGRVAVSFGAVRVQNIRVQQPGLVLTLPSADIELPVLSAASEKILIKSLVAKGWTADLTAPATSTVAHAGSTSIAPSETRVLAANLAAAATPSAPPADRQTAMTHAFQGIFALLNLPVDLAIDMADLEGDVIFSTSPGQPAGRAHVTITGGQLGAGRDGKFAFNASVKLASPDAPVNSLIARSEISARMDTPRTFQRISVSTDATATGPQFPNGTKVLASLAASREASAESYDVTVDSAGKRLLTVKAALPAGATTLGGTAKLTVQDADLAPFALGRPLPGFEADGEVKFSANTAFTTLSVNGTLNAVLSRLEAVMPELKALGRIQVTSTFSVGQEGEAVRVTALTVRAIGDRPVAAIDALQAFEFVPKSGELRVADPSKELVNIALQGVPLVWAQPFLKDLAISGGDVRGEFVVRASGGGFGVRPKTPLTITQLSISQKGVPLVNSIDVAVSAGGDYAPQGWQADLSDLSVTSGGATLLKLSAKAGQVSGQDQPIKATGRYIAELPALAAQPVAADFAVLSKGTAQGEFTASIAAKQELALKLQLVDLVAITKEVLPKVTADVRADIFNDGRIEAQVPLLFEQADHKSDLLLAAAVRPVGETLNVDAQLTSNLIYVEDVKILLAPFSGQPEKPAKPPTKPEKEGPPWAGLSGELKLALKKVVYSPEFQLTDIGGKVVIGPGALTLDNIHAALGEGGTLKVAGGLGYDAATADRYALKADVAITNVDTGAFFRAIEPGRTPPVEGRFDVTTQLNGAAKDLSGLADTTSGGLKLASRGGTLRALAFKVDDKAEKTAGLVSGVAGLLGSFTSNPTAKRYADGLKAAGELAAQLAALNYDQMNVELARSPSNDYEIKDLTLISPTIRLVGTGSIKYQPGVPIWNQPLLLNLQLGARDKTAENLRTLKLIGDNADDLGYALLDEKLTLDGTLSKIGTAQLEKLINRAMTALFQ